MGKLIVNKASGEVLEEPDFVKIYIGDLCAVKGVNSSQKDIFNFMLLNMNWENIVSYGSRSKQKFLDRHNMKNQTFNNNVSALIGAELIERIGRGEFRVNKKYAVKTDWTKVQSIQWHTSYSEEGKQEYITLKKKP